MTPTTKIIVGPCVPGFHGDVARASSNCPPAACASIGG